MTFLSKHWVHIPCWERLPIPEPFIFLEEIEEISSRLPAFSACDAGPTFSLLRMQCKSQLVADPNLGPTVPDANHPKHCLEVLQLANRVMCDILLLPEYSLPVDLISSILQDPSLQPQLGKIWCCGCQGVTWGRLQDLVKEWSALGATVVTHALTQVSPRRFVNMVIYVIRLNDGTIGIVPQLKTFPMADQDLFCEEIGMTRGRLLFKFGRHQANQLCTLICADALDRHRINLGAIFPHQNENMILLHPQLNAYPRHDLFSQIRKDIYNDFAGDRTVYITANWAAGTEIVSLGSDLLAKMSNPWSGIYTKNRQSNWLTPRLRSYIDENHSGGLGFAYWPKGRTNVWYSFMEPNLQLIHVTKPNPGGMAGAQPHCDAIIEQTFVPVGDRWNMTYDRSSPSVRFSHFEDNLNSHVGSLGIEYSYPMTASLHERDLFFGLCLGTEEQDQLITDDKEFCSRMGVYIDEQCETARSSNARLFRILTNTLINSGLPPRIASRYPYHKYHLSSSHNYNLAVSVDGNSQTMQEILISYVDNDKQARRVVDRFSEIHPKEQICIFTQDENLRLISYPLFDDRITAPESYIAEGDITDPGGCWE